MRIAERREWETINDIFLYQYDNIATLEIFGSPIYVEYSSKANKIRKIYNLEKNVLFYIRPNDYKLIPTIKAAYLMHKEFPPNRYRILVKNEVSQEIAQSKNVFAKHVVGADPIIRGYDEVMIVDELDTLLGVGRAEVSGEEVMSYKRGIAVSVREGVFGR